MYSVGLTLSFGDKFRPEMDMIIGDLGNQLEDFRPLWKFLRPIIAQAFARNFATESAISGKWPELTPEYKKRKLREGWPEDILVKTGELLRACTIIGDTAGPNQIMIDEPLMFAFGVTLKYSGYHDRDEGVYGKRREHLALDRQGIDEVFHEITRWTYETAGNSWQGKGRQGEF